jgi:hypothetical protein
MSKFEIDLNKNIVFFPNLVDQQSNLYKIAGINRGPDEELRTPIEDWNQQIVDKGGNIFYLEIRDECLNNWYKIGKLSINTKFKDTKGGEYIMFENEVELLL